MSVWALEVKPVAARLISSIPSHPDPVEDFRLQHCTLFPGYSTGKCSFALPVPPLHAGYRRNPRRRVIGLNVSVCGRHVIICYGSRRRSGQTQDPGHLSPYPYLVYGQQLTIESSKYTDINFIHRRDSVDPFRLLGEKFVWSSPIKIRVFGSPELFVSLFSLKP